MEFALGNNLALKISLLMFKSSKVTPSKFNFIYMRKYNMNVKHIGMTALAAATIGFAGNAAAGTIPYANVGTENAAAYSFTATNTGDVVAYFFNSTAAYVNELTLLVNGVETGIQGLNNHTSVYGQSLVLGHANAGDSLVFKMVNIAPGGVGPWYSDKSMNSDGVQHLYSTDFAGDFAIPSGTFVAFEDLPNGGDFNYNDETFVFGNVSTSTNVPEPATLLLTSLGLGVLGLRSRRSKK